MNTQEEQKAARVMHEDYNNTVGGWVNESIETTLPELLKCVNKMYEKNPERFLDTNNPLSVADFGCATGASSIKPLRTVIDRVKEINPAMQVQVYLNDLPENRFDLAFQSVQAGLKDYDNVFIMAAGKDFSTQVFPNKFLDISFSSLTAMIMPTAFAPLEDNLFFLANPENIDTEAGKKWVEGFNKHWKNFMNARQAELKKDGLLFVTLIINQDPNRSYQTKENEFFHEIATLVVKDVLKKHNLEDKIAGCMKTTISLYKQHYIDVCNSFDTVEVISSNDFDVKDIFYHEYVETQDREVFGKKVSSYIQGWWGDVLEGGLAQQGVEQDTIKQVSKEVFERLPAFISERTERYPEYYNVLALAVQKL